MKKFLIYSISLAFLLTFSISADASTTKFITLEDGTVIKGIVTDFEDGEYTVATENLGEIQIKDTDIVSMETQEKAASSDSEDLKSQVDDIRGQVMQDEDIMQDINKMVQDEEMLKLLTDQSLVDDVLSFDEDKIRANQKVQELFENEEMQRLIEKVNQKVTLDEYDE